MSKEHKPEHNNGRKYSKQVGPLHVPPHLLDPNYYYRWISYSKDAPFKMETELQKGFVPVLKQEMEDIKSLLSQYGFASEVTNSTVGGMLSRTGKDNTTLYLMKLPKERERELRDDMEEDILERERYIKTKIRSEGGDSLSDFNTPVFKNNHIFKI